MEMSISDHFVKKLFLSIKTIGVTHSLNSALTAVRI